MKLTVRRSRLHGEIAVSGSKSHTIRGIVAGLLSSGTGTLVAPLESSDTRSALEAAKRLGAEVSEQPGKWVIRGTAGDCRNPGSVLDLGNSGSGLRMLSGAAALQNFSVGFDGDSSLRTRTMGGLLSALEQLGARVESTGGKCPLTIRGPVRGGTAQVDGSTSQFLTALLFSLPLAAGNSSLSLEFLNEQPYIGITLN